MSLAFALSELLEHTEWEREAWRSWLAEQGSAPLAVDLGPHRDGRFGTVGELIRHIFSAELRYVERLTGRPLTDPASVPAGDAEALFAFGRRSREALRAFVATPPEQGWDTPEMLEIGPHRRVVTPRKIVLHVVVHELRHWAQIATLLRLAGWRPGMHDVLFSPVLTLAPDTPE